VLPRHAVEIGLLAHFVLEGVKGIGKSCCGEQPASGSGVSVRWGRAAESRGQGDGALHPFINRFNRVTSVTSVTTMSGICAPVCVCARARVCAIESFRSILVTGDTGYAGGEIGRRDRDVFVLPPQRDARPVCERGGSCSTLPCRP
jgi:hypothetical protein